MATASIKIVGYQDPELTFDIEGVNFIAIPNTVPPTDFQGINFENPNQEAKNSRKLTWRDFTIDMSPFDYKYYLMTGLKVEEYGSYNPNNIQELTPNNNEYCLHSDNGVTADVYPVGSFIPLIYDNVTSSTNKSNVREDILPISKIYMTPVVTGQPTGYHYVKIRLYYNNRPSDKVKVIYNVVGATYPNTIGKYLNNATIRVTSGSVSPISVNNLLEGLDYKTVRSNNLSQVVPWSQALENITWPSEDYYQGIFPDLMISDPRGNPLKITIWDDNVNKRILINGNPLVNGMSIPFEMFKAGQVFFNSIGMAETDNYEVHFSIMDLISGVMVINFQE